VRYGEDYNFIVILPMIFKAGLGVARLGKAWQGEARQSKESYLSL
jgi:hypothetical protein